MTRNPYKPPSSDVRDLQPGRMLAERPREVIHAVRLLWLSIVIAVPMIYFEQQRSPHDAEAFVWLFSSVIIALAAALNVYVWRGANWARIIVLVLGIVSLLSVAAIIEEVLAFSPLEMGLQFISVAIDAVVIYLLFTKPGALWFRRAPPG